MTIRPNGPLSGDLWWQYHNEQQAECMCPGCGMDDLECECPEDLGDATVSRHPGEDWAVYYGGYIYCRPLTRRQADRLAARVNEKRPDLAHLVTSEYWELVRPER